jgi:hypothetical protein
VVCSCLTARATAVPEVLQVLGCSWGADASSESCIRHLRLLGGWVPAVPHGRTTRWGRDLYGGGIVPP